MRPRTFWLGFAAICLAIIVAGVLLGTDRGPGRVPTAVDLSGIGALIFVFAAYFLPAIVAAWRHHPSANAITALDLLLGWTVLGWVVALVWALAGRQPATAAPAEDGRRPCPHCAEAILPAARLCRFCGHALSAGWAAGGEVVTLRRHGGTV